MITRRHALRIAAGLAAATTVAPRIASAEAADLLDQPLDAGDPLTLPSGTHDLDNPPAFADRMHFRHNFDERDHSLFDYIAPEEHAAYAQRRAALYEAMPLLRNLPFDNAFTQMDDSILDWVLAAYGKGLSDGTAYEHLRLALTGPTRLCNDCDGYGILDGENAVIRPHRTARAEPTTCARCKGRGVLSNA